MEKLVVCIMGDSCEKFLDMCIQSVISADRIIFCWGKEDIKTKTKIIEWQNRYPHIEIIENKFDQEDKGMNGKQRNFYLNYLKENYSDYWALCLDADEVIEDLSKIKDFIQTVQGGLYSVKMRHFHNDLGHEDSTKETHYVLNRLFKIREVGEYPKVEHTVLMPKVQVVSVNQEIPNVIMGKTECTTIWHLAHINHCFNIKNRYENNIKHSNIHSPEFLDDWKDMHMLGKYPNREVNILEVPNVITEYFHINKDKYYFKDRNIEGKHIVDAVDWKGFFMCEDAWEVGCGKGPRVWAMNRVGIDTIGLEISKYACDNGFTSEYVKIINEDISKPLNKLYDEKGLVVCYDVLEHIEYDKIDIAITNIIDLTQRYILISVPFKGTPNCDNDPTHRIKESREWWIKKFMDKGLKQIKTPERFLFKEQILIFERSNYT